MTDRMPLLTPPPPRFSRVFAEGTGPSAQGGAALMRPCEHRPSALRRARPARPYAAALLALAALLASLLPSAATAQAPSIVSISMASSPGSDQTYDRGERISVHISFGTTRLSVTGSPRVALNIGGKTRYAVFFIGTLTLTFDYIVQLDDLDANGISIPANPIDLNGGTITLASDSSVNADLTHAGVSDQSGHKVDATGEYLDYSAAPSALTVGTTITPLTATPLGFTSGAAFTYAVTTGALPPGLTLSSTTGAITGAPTTVSASSVTVTVTATAGQRDGDRGHHLPGGVGAHPGHRARRGERG